VVLGLLGRPVTVIKMAHAIEFLLVNGPIGRPLEVIRLLAKGGLPLNIARSLVERLATTHIKGRYFHERDRVYIEIASGPGTRTYEVANGLMVDFDADGNVIGLDIDNASRLGALLRDFIASGATVEDLAWAWASLDGQRDDVDKEKSLGAPEDAHDYYLGYLAAAEEILRRAANYARDHGAILPGSPAKP
jgi:uncharacterized protein YuzE